MPGDSDSTYIPRSQFRLLVDGIIGEHGELATDTELAEHASDTTLVHGITDTTKLVVGPAGAIEAHFALFTGSEGNKLVDSGTVKTTDGTFPNNSDGAIPSEKAVKTYVDKLKTEAVLKEATAGGDLAGKYPNPEVGPEKVGTAKIANLAVTEGKLGAESVTAGKLGPLAVTTAKINTGAVTETKLGAESVTAGKIGAESVIAEKLGAGAVTAEKMATAAKEQFLQLAGAAVASAATITVSKATTLVEITGVTGITKINATAKGHMIVLKFAEALTVTDGENLKLKENFVTTADDTLTLICNGTNWYEIARSVN